MIEITLPWPPSVNSYWRTPRSGPLAGRTMISEAGREYRAAVADQVLIQRAAHRLAMPLSVDIEVIEPDRRVRDLDNLLKATLDSLTHAGVWEDDHQIDELRVWRIRGRIGGMLKIRICPSKEASSCNA